MKAPASTFDMCLISAPAAKKPATLEPTTTTLIASSASASSITLFNPSMIGVPRAFAGGRCKVTRSTLSPTRSETTAFAPVSGIAQTFPIDWDVTDVTGVAGIARSRETASPDRLRAPPGPRRTRAACNRSTGR